MQNFEILITSVPDRENLVAEIWLEKNLVCEISNDNETLEIEFFKEIGKKFDYSKLLEALKEAKSKLLAE
ncbi:hypothetical protein B4Q04_20230 [Zobellia sp. OII3]|uniref:hypothetical protein n=1 Tax=Zobellia sp. OII3 TaxID=2034520 RepID=UPI000B53805B|nr:hypothetical protein [Zobellia sp. OII3]OWW23527.1 hypothetical protein B4Q04_20230 [Zobellia sp. OII3]